MESVPMTAEGHVALSLELKRRTTIERGSIVAAIAEARAHGDLSENAEYHAAKEQQSMNEGRIRELESYLSRADVIDIKSVAGDSVKFGATVTVIDEDTEETTTYQVVGDAEADITNGKVSISSPLTLGLMGKSVGDSVEVNAPGGVRNLELVSIKYI